MTPKNADGERLVKAKIESVLKELVAIRTEMISESAGAQARLGTVHPTFRESARNLLHYLVLRRRDLRPLQAQLAAMGLSSLGRAESHVLAAVDAVLDVLHRLNGGSGPAPAGTGVDCDTGDRLLSEHAESLLGAAAPNRGVRIMVTMPGEAADDYELVHDLLQQGMECMRINCAHDGPAAWGRMIEHLRRAEQELGRSCRVFMDLAGPKLRTGPLEPGPAVVRIRPRRDVFGRVTARAGLADRGRGARPGARGGGRGPAGARGLVGPGPRRRAVGPHRRARARRIWTVVDVTEPGCWAEAAKTAYVVPGTVLTREHEVAADRTAAVGGLPAGESAISLHNGDALVLTRDLRPGRPATFDSAGRILTPAQIGCSIPEVFDDVKAGESIWFDDGKIGGVVESVEAARVLVRITRAPLRAVKLRADKGINLPESDLRLPALTAKDLEDLAFVARHADVVELSFANTVRDVEELQEHLARSGGRQPAIVLKVETRRGFQNLPHMLLTAMRAPCCGVMIARGDLAVECGFERLAEVQEEMLWICEAAHVPVIWATQVLESLAKDGMPSRAEITDAAMGDRAECVMLNKGPHVVRAVRVLDDILRRMQSHQSKKRAMLRELRLAHLRPPGPERADVP
ncbi:pyruvate kinase [Frigoriglobus tundricola]|uniref:pyruvate kinase n=1 Tax=Frigoriglobus tundricola TaxID=2774151 RepID=A0A6M5YJ86_9BACT|nr:pyruvate kinase [Frigoriglobus tundricola]QJW93032.1 Pyruvate kinase family protein [Frigoriglobus tundricola]